MASVVRQRKQNNGKRDPKKLAGRKLSAIGRNEEIPSNPNPADIGIVYPSGDTAFKALLSARFCAAMWNSISDCDETFNYWEPSHYLLFGKGFQTWEYSPEYALRSYTYLLIHVVPAWLYHQLLQPNRFLIFYFSRCLLGLLCAFCEVYFYKSICREFGIQVGRLALAFLVFSAGMFISSTAFLPSTFSMYMCLVSLGAWYQRKYELAIFTTALSSFLSWPFAALIGVPIAVDMLFRRREIIKFFNWSLISVAVILLPMVKLDSSYFGHLVVAPFNIVYYNVFTSHGPDLYGTEPFHFYFINLFLNFNLLFVAAILTPLMLIIVAWLVPSKPRNPACLPYWLSLMPLYLWGTVFFTQPHKEERFMFPVYPLICLCGAITVDSIQKLWFRFCIRDVERGTHYLTHTAPIMVVAVLVCSLLSVSRILALYIGYHAPLDLFMELNHLTTERHLPTEQTVNICIGKEWYRFPSSFFLPDNRWQLQFLKSEFRGQLPQPYSSLPNATSIIPPYMNNENREETSRYFDIERCHFLVDLDLGVTTDFEPNYAQQTDQWTIIKSIPFLDAARSHRFFRAFYIPGVSSKFCTYAPYNLLQSTRFKWGKKEVPLPTR
ncbi:Alpha-1,2-mannosyltransferase ALG9 [Cryptotermes secundus]|uniref:Mannosyltransferase n=2 Tax=Cryptotermes secundus TaxID=105785 RepID=A0A2J7R5Y4_9NEOP|nr:alpha-1,2-mannosyltransferase ALG9 isoform X1 [Cryptotermes secundus]XP_023705033.1 alpha-1,2-mannosyltransferase ALG9 isoform X1 [Cryptotermes secundus]XP_023705034.1 alpha-1,2-mannosyltransferase ALG9 isoform X1 [Cryptotermes secundus]XP_023705035.1 alpha-1,2-mannosyltransferase ALG9 isoform X1 [Cryptotermes secundus]XP_023705036.1 alpha-1,2-mannosyltransferase ALG9 isoform X1 [Cryptotermes secundus]XP_023705037.1 alpha-1,2-mannosyltransferase ALG9 isoform X1 [Cryptotermes secundus]XP_02